MGNVGANSTHNCEAEEDWPWVNAIRDPEVLDWRQFFEENQQHSTALLQSTEPAEILPWLFLSSGEGARDVCKLKAVGITDVLNCTGHPMLPKSDYDAATINVRIISSEDEEGYPMLKTHLKSTIDWIKEIKSSNNQSKILIHCHAGINRSGVLVAALHLLETRIGVCDTVKAIRIKRGNMYLTNESFQSQLVAFARKEGLLGSEPGISYKILTLCVIVIILILLYYGNVTIQVLRVAACLNLRNLLAFERKSDEM